MQIGRLSDQLRYWTIRIQVSFEENTNWSNAGTGFLYVFGDDVKQAPLLVTNKHVVSGAKVVGLNFHVTTDNNESPAAGAGRLISFRTTDVGVISHPDPDVDLAAISLAPVINFAVQNQGWQPYIKCLDKSCLPSDEMIDQFRALEDIIMVGYPTGLVDTANNFPIVRRGITSTPYSANYQGKREFLADIPVFGGSSGSPVFILNEGSYTTGNGLIAGNRFALLGVLYAGHTQTVDGKIVTKPIPTNLAPVAEVTHMINLGLCIKSSLIEDLRQQIPGLN